MRRSFAFMVMLPLYVTCCFAEPFDVQQYSAGLQGNALAGMTAKTDDVVDIRNNPALLTTLTDTQFYFNTNGDMIVHHNENATFTQTLGNNAGGATLGRETGGYSSNEFFNLSGAFYMGEKISPNVALGISVETPWAVKSDYPANWVGRYVVVKSNILSINLQPDIAFRFSKSFSVGLGLQLQKTDADFHEVAGNYGATNEVSEIRGHDYGVGYTLGMLYQATDKLSIGASYISKVTTTVSMSGPLYTAAGAPPTSSEAILSLDTPAIANLGFSYKMAQQWRMLGNVQEIFWKGYVMTGQTTLGNARVDNRDHSNLDNIVIASLGTDHIINQTWHWHSGLAYEHLPYEVIHGGVFGGTLWFAGGLSYQASPNKRYYLSFLHVMNHTEHENINVSTTIDPNDPDPTRLVNDLDMNTRSHANVISFGASIRF